MTLTTDDQRRLLDVVRALYNFWRRRGVEQGPARNRVADFLGPIYPTAAGGASPAFVTAVNDIFELVDIRSPSAGRPFWLCEDERLEALGALSAEDWPTEVTERAMAKLDVTRPSIDKSAWPCCRCKCGHPWIEHGLNSGKCAECNCECYERASNVCG